MALLPPTTTPTRYSVRLTPSIHPYAVSPDLLNLWLDSMFISPLELSWEIRWCTTATQSVIELSWEKVQVMQTWVEVAWSLYVDCCGILSKYYFYNFLTTTIHINILLTTTNLGHCYRMQLWLHLLAMLQLLEMEVHFSMQRQKHHTQCQVDQ